MAEQLISIGEEWREAPGYEGRYEVSSLGRVRSYCVKGSRTGAVTTEPHILRQSLSGPDTAKYLKVCLGQNNRVRVHVIVLTTFVGPRPLGAEGRHLDGDTLNNRVVNLSWGTREENTKDKLLHGKTKGEKHWNATLSDAQVTEIRNLITCGTLHRDIAAQYGISRSHVSSIWTGAKR